jgi:hypothetical protein
LIDNILAMKGSYAFVITQTERPNITPQNACANNCSVFEMIAGLMVL